MNPMNIFDTPVADLPLPEDMTEEERRIYEAAPTMRGNHPLYRREIARIVKEALNGLRVAKSSRPKPARIAVTRPKSRANGF